VAEFDLKAIMDNAGGYSPNAYRFIRDGLGHTVGMVHGAEALQAPPDEDDDSRHVSGRELCLGLRDFALRRYGLMAQIVLNHWGVTRTEDFGRIVFALVDAGLLRKTDEDTIEDFQGVFDFGEEFAGPIDDLLESSD